MPIPVPEPANKRKKEEKQKLTRERIDELLPLFRILMKEPPKDHDFKTCPICKEYGITHI